MSRCRNLCSIVFLLAIIVCQPLAHAAASDTLQIIHSFYRSQEDQSMFATTSNGDSVGLVFSAKISARNAVYDTTHIQVRTWNSLTSQTLNTRNYFHTQAADQTTIYRVGNLDGTPHLFYCPSLSVMRVSRLFDGTTVRDINFPAPLAKYYPSPDFSKAFFVTVDDRFFVVDTRSGEFLLQDTVYASKYVMYKGINSYEHYKVACVANSWTSDNSLLMFRVARLREHADSSFNLSYEPYWRGFDLKTKSYVTDTIPFQMYGRWLPNAKRFVSYNALTFFVTTLDRKTTQVATGKYIYDFAWVDGTNQMTIVDPGTTISMWNMDALTLKHEFAPGSIRAYAFNSDGNLLAYVVANTLTVINTVSYQGIYSYTIDFNDGLSFSDSQSFFFLNGDKAIAIRDQNGAMRVVDLALNKVVCTVSASATFLTSSNGNALFVQDTLLTRFDILNGKQISRFPEGELQNRVLSVALSPNGKHILSVDTTIRLWDAKTALQLRAHHYDSVQTVQWTENDSLALLFCRTGLRKHAIVINGYTLDSIGLIGSSQRLLGFAANKYQYFLSTSFNNAGLFDMRTGQSLASFQGTSPLTAACQSYDGTLTALGDTSGYIRVFNTQNQSQVMSVYALSPIRKLVISRNNKYLSYISAAGNVIYRIADSSRVQGLSKATYESMFIQNDSTCVCVYDDAIIEFKTNNGTSFQILTASRAHFRRDGQLYAVAIPDVRDSFAVYNYRSRSVVTSLKDAPSNSAVVWSHNAKTLATVDIFNNIVIWSPQNIPDTTTTINAVSEFDVDAFLCVPQPASSTLQVIVGDERQVLSSRIRNLCGLQVEVEQYSPSQLDVSGLAAGVYVLECLLSDARIASRTFVVRR